MLRGLALSIGLYCVVTGLLIGVVILCGGEFHQIPGFLFLVIGACTGIGASIIDDKLN
tara:strand:+ start:613 stop:786 length:174 start_codon:yes stop_codon:yes gene_type:complete